MGNYTYSWSHSVDWSLLPKVPFPPIPVFYISLPRVQLLKYRKHHQSMVMVQETSSVYGHGTGNIISLWSWYRKHHQSMVIVQETSAVDGHSTGNIISLWSWYRKHHQSMVIVQETSSVYGHGTGNIISLWS